jgi:hypothetical protein
MSDNIPLACCLASLLPTSLPVHFPPPQAPSRRVPDSDQTPVATPLHQPIDSQFSASALTQSLKPVLSPGAWGIQSGGKFRHCHIPSLAPPALIYPPAPAQTHNLSSLFPTTSSFITIFHKQKDSSSTSTTLRARYLLFNLY